LSSPAAARSPKRPGRRELSLPLDPPTVPTWARLAGRTGLARWLARPGGPQLVDDTGRPLPGHRDQRGPCLVVLDDRALGALLRSGTQGLGLAYVAGWWEAEDLAGVVGALAAVAEPLQSRLDALFGPVAPVLDRLRRPGAPSPTEDRAAVRAHYDLPPALFRSMLDETMAYSCAVFEPPGIDLAEAQRVKFERILAPLELGPGDDLLEIGTGWGGLAIHAASTRGCRVTTTTISPAQRDAARRAVDQAGVRALVSVLGAHWRDLRGRFDALVSVEMIEAVDWRHHQAFFEACRRLLGDRGRMSLQAIVIDQAAEPRARHRPDFIRAQVFPNSCIPSVSRLVTLAARAGLQTVALSDIGPHYAETLRRWRANLEDAAPGLGEAGLDPRLLRLWRLYLAYCEAAFERRHISDVQLVLAPRPGRAGR
jgi:cyclopropane-fatty-acyl-phospholipid synthase